MRDFSVIVTSDWLEKNYKKENLIVLDIRLKGEYMKGHIPGSVNIPFPDAVKNHFSDWYTERNGLILELPDKNSLFKTLGKAGIHSDSWVIIVPELELPRPLADASRAAVTLMHAGVKQVGVLDGGFCYWKKEERPVSSGSSMNENSLVHYDGEINQTIFISKQYITDRIGLSEIVDAREAFEYFGNYLRAGEWTRRGHIPTAKSLPAFWVWNENLRFKSMDELQDMAAGVVGTVLSREIIIYCGVGGLSPTWFLLLSEEFGYQNVKIFNGSVQEWSQDLNAPLVSYRWE